MSSIQRVFASGRGMSAQGILQKLASIQMGGPPKNKAVKFKKRDLIHMMRNISTLIENGLTLPKAIETISREKSLKRYAGLLDQVRIKLESGEMFSTALSQCGKTFSDLFINQIRVGERSGTLPDAIQRLTEQLERGDDLKARIIKKLAYPVMLVTVGSGAVSFMILYVVPTFEKTYAESGAKLPAITQLLISVGAFASAYGWLLILAAMLAVAGIIAVRRNPQGRLWMDHFLLRIPFIGEWLKNIAVLQFMEVLGNLMEAGFTIVDALKVCAGSIGNRAVRKSVEQLHSAILRGERFSAELERHSDLFPPVVNQLVIVGEKTGTLSKATMDIRKHLSREVERTTNLLIGTIEPVLTIGLATCIGGILLAIYLPMFDMISAMNGGGH